MTAAWRLVDKMAEEDGRPFLMAYFANRVVPAIGNLLIELLEDEGFWTKAEALCPAVATDRRIIHALHTIEHSGGRDAQLQLLSDVMAHSLHQHLWFSLCDHRGDDTRAAAELLLPLIVEWNSYHSAAMIYSMGAAERTVTVQHPLLCELLQHYGPNALRQVRAMDVLRGAIPPLAGREQYRDDPQLIKESAYKQLVAAIADLKVIEGSLQRRGKQRQRIIEEAKREIAEVEQMRRTDDWGGALRHLMRSFPLPSMSHLLIGLIEDEGFWAKAEALCAEVANTNRLLRALCTIQHKCGRDASIQLLADLMAHSQHRQLWFALCDYRGDDARAAAELLFALIVEWNDYRGHRARLTPSAVEMKAFVTEPEHLQLWEECGPDTLRQVQAMIALHAAIPRLQGTQYHLDITWWWNEPWQQGEIQSDKDGEDEIDEEEEEEQVQFDEQQDR